jgi:hypothetical protein
MTSRGYGRPTTERDKGATAMTTEQEFDALNRLVGDWTTEAKHPALPGVIVHGTAVTEWLDGHRFLISRAHTDHPDFPDSISILGFTDQDRVDDAPGGDGADVVESRLCMHYFDSRGVFRIYEVSVDDETWQMWRDATGFSQRFTGTFVDGGQTINGQWQVALDDINWNDDLQITFRRCT